MTSFARSRYVLGQMKAGLSILFLLLATAPAALGQATSGQVAGSVSDASGGAMPGANVSLVSASRGTSISTVTNATGDFTFPSLLADTYTVRVTMSGFKTVERPNVVVTLGERNVLPALVLEIGGVNETVTVTTETAALNTASGERSFTVTAEATEALPIASRGYTALAALAPGTIGTNRLGGGGSNNFMQDGVSTVEPGGGQALLTLTPDAVAEVRVLVSGYQAEFGRSSGMQISAVTKSGTNQFHGSVYDVERNSDWNQRTWAQMKNGDPKSVTKERDWGYTIGGPVGRPGGSNKLFFFYSHEYRPRLASGAINRRTVPTALERMGDFSQTVDNNGNPFRTIRDASLNLPCTTADTRGCFQDGGVLGRIPQSRLYGPAVNALNMWPLPNASGIGYNFESSNPETRSRVMQPLVRVDYQASSDLRLLAKWNPEFQGTPYRAGVMPGITDVKERRYRQLYSVNATYTLTPTLVLEGTYGYYKSWASNGVPVADASNRNLIGLGDFPTLFPDAGVVDPRYFSFEELARYNTPMFANGRVLLPPAFQWGNRIANAPPTPSFGFVNATAIRDTSLSLTKLVGRHTIKSGFYWNQSWKAQNEGGFAGTVNFGQDANSPMDTGFGFSNAAIGAFTSYAQTSKFVDGDFIYDSFDWYVQDNWKKTSRLTLDYGVRLVHQGPTYDRLLQGSTFFPERWDASQAPLLYLPACANNAATCSAANRQAKDPRNGNLLGPGSNINIGTIVPSTGNLLNGVLQQGQQGIAKEGYVWPTLAIAPRGGFAYDVRGTQDLVLRGGFGVFYDRPGGNSSYALIGNPPNAIGATVRFSQLQTLGTGGLTTTSPAALDSFQYDIPLPRSLQWNGGVQMALPGAMSLDFEYVGQRADNMLASYDINQVNLGAAYLAQNQDPTLTSANPGGNALSTDLLRPLRGFGAINQQWARTWNEVHSLQSSLNRRFRNGFQYGLNYTLTLDQTGNTGVPIRLQHAPDGSFAVRDDQAEIERLQANTGLRRHIIKGSFVWSLPRLERWKAVGLVANGWQLSGILTAGSGPTYDVSASYTGLGSVNLTGSPAYAPRVTIVGDPGSGCSSDQYRQIAGGPEAFRGPTFNSDGLESGRNYLTGCFDKTMDLSIQRIIRFGGRSAQIRVDMFNAFATVVYSGRVTGLQFDNPTAQTLLNPQYNADGTLNQARLTPNAAGFGAATGAQAMRSVQAQVRFTF